MKNNAFYRKLFQSVITRILRVLILLILKKFRKCKEPLIIMDLLEKVKKFHA
jgi:hypothetical protein